MASYFYDNHGRSTSRYHDSSDSGSNGNNDGSYPRHYDNNNGKDHLHSRHYDSSFDERTRRDSRLADNQNQNRYSAATSDKMSGRLQPAYPHSHTHTRPYHNGYGDEDTSYPYTTLPYRSRSKSRRRTSPPRPRRTWPPPPTVEDEKTALARESRHDQGSVSDETPSRGSLDQDPIILEVPEYIPDRRFVMLPSESKTTKSNPTPPTSDDERNKRGRKKVPKLETVSLPEMGREPSPYAWTKPCTASSTSTASATSKPLRQSSGDLFLSPDTMTPAVAAKSANIPRSVPSSHASAGKKNTSERRLSSHARHDSTTSEDEPRTRPAHTRTASTHKLPHVQPSSHYPPSPPRSPRLGQDRFRATPPSSLPPSKPTSQTASVHASPQPSPRLSRSSTATDALWGSVAASAAAALAGAAHHSRQSSRRSTPTIPESSRAPPRSVPLSQPQQPSFSLPYPDEDTTFQSMPSERDHMYLPPDQPPIHQPVPENISRPVSRSGLPTSSAPLPLRRPELPTRNSAVQDFPPSPRAPGYARPVSSAGPTTKLKTPSQLKALARPLPSCSRQSYSSEYDEWFTLDGCPSFDICSGCLETVFNNTIYRSSFKPSPSRLLVGRGLQVRCDFGDAWVRLGWLLIVQRESTSLDLIKALVNTSPPSDSDEACPGAVEAVRDWYSIRDRDGHFLRGFAVCSADVRKLQTLFPGFRELWQPLPMRNSYSYANDFGGLMRTCSLRPALNNRFPQYIDTLVRIHEPAYQAGRMPDVSDFVSLVRRKTLMHECTRDDMVREQPWHFIPSLLPAFTVCEDCYDAVVMPAIEKDADVAMRFNREAQIVHNEGRLGSSCQLYSSRMRNIFQRAVQDNDLKYLARKAIARKETEDRLQERVTDNRRLIRRLKASSGVYGLSLQASHDLETLEQEMHELSDEWMQWE